MLTGAPRPCAPDPRPGPPSSPTWGPRPSTPVTAGGFVHRRWWDRLSHHGPAPSPVAPTHPRSRRLRTPDVPTARILTPPALRTTNRHLRDPATM